MAAYRALVVIVLVCGSANLAYANVGSGCVVSGQPGVCRLFKDCTKARNDLKESGIAPTRCPSQNFQAVVCCAIGGDNSELMLTRESPCPPLPTGGLKIKKDGRKARDKCIDWYELLHPCVPSLANRNEKHRPDLCGHKGAQLIIGGTEAKEIEFPHMVLLGFDIDSSTVSWECGGTLISEDWVLTAGHCIWTQAGGDVAKARVGETNVRKPPPPEYLFNIKKIIKHPNYVGNKKYDDIALLQLDRKVTFSDHVIPACLHMGDPVVDEKALATGWGLTVAGVRESQSGTLMKVVLEKFTYEECAPRHSPTRQNPDGLRNLTQVCYGSHNEKKDTCQGDSGSPLQIYNQDVECMYTIIGLTSYGKSCGSVGLPAIYTRIAPYIPWIESVVWP